MQGKVLPQIGIVEINMIDEDLTRLLQFERGGLDFALLRGEVATRLLENGKLKPEYAARGVMRIAFPEPFGFYLYFNVADAVIGGMDNEHIALRRAIAFALDTEELTRIVYAGQAIPANQIVPPGVGGHDSTLPMKSLYDPATAKALLDRFGYERGNARMQYFFVNDRWVRDRTLGHALQEAYRGLLMTGRYAVAFLFLSMPTDHVDVNVHPTKAEVGLRTAFRQAPFQDIIKELEKGKFQLYYGGFGGSPSGYAELVQLSGKQPERVNVSHFKLAEYDRSLDQFLRTGDDEEQVGAARTMSEIARTYMPQLPAVYRLDNHFVQPWVQGFAPPVFSSYWKYLDIDLALRRRTTEKARP